MADKKISQLSAATTPLAGTEVLPVVQGGSTVKVSAADVTAGRAVSALTYTSTATTGTAPFTVSSTTQVANLNAATAGTASNLLSNATTGVLQVTGPGTGTTRVMTTPNANFTVARTDAANAFSGTQSITNDTADTNTAVDVLTISQTSTGTAAAGLGAGVLFKSERPSGGINLSRGAIYGVSGPDADDDGYLSFYTLTSTAPGDFNEKWRITSPGDLQATATGRAIRDQNGNEYLKFSTVASAVNELNIYNNSTGLRPTIEATGDDTNIGIQLLPKGTGTVFVSGNLGVDTTASYKIQSAVASGANRDMFLSGVTGVTNGFYVRYTHATTSIDFRVASLPTTASAANAFLDSAADNQLYRSTSSIRYKKDVESIEQKYADNALNLRPVWYRSKAPNDNGEWSWYGLIAEEVAEIDPRLVHWTYPDEAYDVQDVDGQIKKTLKPDAERIPDGVQYERLSVLLLDVVKRQNERLEKLEAEVAALKGSK